MATEQPRRIMVTGGRDFDDPEMVHRALSAHVRPGDTLVSGHASGADKLSEEWAKARGIDVDECPADWYRKCDENCYHPPRRRGNGRPYCPAAGVIRNGEMVNSGVALVVAFPGARGTADAKRRARKAGVEVVEAASIA